MPTPTQRGSVLSASDAAAGDNFGRAVALSSDAQILAVGAQNWEGATGTDRGGVYIYDWSTSWTQRGSVLEASDAANSDAFGTNVALSGNGLVLAVGAYTWEGATGSNRGGVYIYDWSGSAWVQRGSVLEASDAADNDGFGISVALSNDGAILAVGAWTWEGATGTNRGGVYTYDWSGSAWVQRGGVLEAGDAADNDNFGFAVALSNTGSVLAVGAVSWESTGIDRGGVYIYDWSGSAWVQRGSVLEAGDAANSDFFGSTVALNDDGAILAIGAYAWEGATGTDRGGVYLYDSSGSAWNQRGSVLEAGDAADSDLFGRGVAISDNGALIAVGAAQWESGAITNQGGVYLYTVQTQFTGSGSALASASGALTTAIKLAGAAVTVATATGALTVPIALSGAAASLSAASGALDTQTRFSGSATGQASLAGGLSTAIQLAGSVTAEAVAAGALSAATLPLNGAAAAVADAAGDLTTQITLDAAAVVQALAAAGLTTGIQLAGDARIQVTATGTMSDLIGAAQSQANATGDLTAQINISAAAVVQALASAGLTTGIRLDGPAQGNATATGGITTQITLNAAAVVEALAAGGLATAIQLQGSASGQASAAAYLTTLQFIFGAASGTATAGGTLTAAPDPAKTFILGGLSLPFESHLDLSQEFIEEVASRITRHCDGSARKQTAWRGKLRTRISGQGWIPPGFDLLDFETSMEMACIALRAVTSASNVITLPAARRADRGFLPFAYATVGGGKVDTTMTLTGNTATVATVAGAAFYTVCYYPKLTVFATLPSQRHDAINDKYTWDFEAREV